MRVYEQELKFPTYTLSIGIDEVRHGNLFTGTAPNRVAKVGDVAEIIPASCVRFEKAGFCVVHVGHADATAEDTALFEKEMKAAQAEGTFPPMPEGPAILSGDEMKIALATIGNLPPEKADKWRAEQFPRNVEAGGSRRVEIFTRPNMREWQEIRSLSRNKFDDIVITLMDGRAIQFVPQARMKEKQISIERIEGVLQGERGLSIIRLVNPRDDIWGDFQIVAVPATPEPKTGKRGKRKYGKNHNLNGRDKWAVRCLIMDIAGGKLKKGETRPGPSVVAEQIYERAKTHRLLQGRIMPGIRTLEGWVSKVLSGDEIPGAHP